MLRSFPGFNFKAALSCGDNNLEFIASNPAEDGPGCSDSPIAGFRSEGRLDFGSTSDGKRPGAWRLPSFCFGSNVYLGIYIIAMRCSISPLLRI